MTDREGVKSLYTFLREFTKLRSKTISNYRDHEWIKPISDIHHEYDDITLYFRDKTTEDDADDDLTLGELSYRNRRPANMEKKIP